MSRRAASRSEEAARSRKPVPIDLSADGAAAVFVFDTADDPGASHLALESVARTLASVIASAPATEAVLRSGTLVPPPWLAPSLPQDPFRPARFLVGVEALRQALRTLLRRWSRVAPRSAARGALVDTSLGDWLEARAVIRNGICTLPDDRSLGTLLYGTGLPTRTMDRSLFPSFAAGQPV